MTIGARTNLPRAAELFHALSDQTRLSILQRLRLGERCVCDLTDVLDVAQSRLSFHLKTLREAGLVTDRREGRWVYYELVPETLTALAGALTALTTPGGAEVTFVHWRADFPPSAEGRQECLPHQV